MKASMTKQGMSPAIIPNKNHWYASITFQVKAARAERAADPRSGLLTATRGRDLAIVRQTFVLSCQPHEAVWG